MDSSALFQALRQELHKAIVGFDTLIDRLIIALLTDGHVLLEGVPGLAKTKILLALAKAIGADMKRIQFTPDLLPTDLIGTEVYRPQTSSFELRKGPVFTNILLADEINRAPAKVQSALLQAMQEKLVTIGEETFKLPHPFLVLATQNPIEHEGTYPLPEAQIDRFMMKLELSYPKFEEELEILKLHGSSTDPLDDIKKVFGFDELSRCKSKLSDVYIDDKIDRYIVSLVQATRNPAAYGLENTLQWGASPRASIALRKVAQAHAFLHSRDFVTPDDVIETGADVLRHRLLLTIDAELRGISVNDILRILFKEVPLP